MKEKEIFGWINILGSSMGMIKLSTQPVPEIIPYWMVLLVSLLLMAQFMWGVSVVRKLWNQ